MSDRLRWLGHSTVLVELDGVRLLTDPLLRKQVLHLRRSPPLELGAVAELDAVLVSHIHHDHLDLPSLRRLGRGLTIVVPRGAGRLLGRAGFGPVVELGAGEEARIGSLVVHAVPAQHASRRFLGPETKALGYVVAGSRRVYFSGDTALFPGMAELGTPIDVALLPIWGWGPSLGPGHLDPAQRRRGARARPPASRRPDPLGHLLPRDLDAARAARVPERPRRGVRPGGGRAGARRGGARPSRRRDAPARP